MRIAKSIPISSLPVDIVNLSALSELLKENKSATVHIAVKYALRNWPSLQSLNDMENKLNAIRKAEGISQDNVEAERKI